MTPFGRSLLVLGGARSGKSRHAQAVAEAAAGAAGDRLVFIATAEPLDAEMAERIDRHRADRCARWHTREAPTDLPGAIRAEDGPEAVLLVDCLTLWVSNLLLHDRDVARATADLVEAMARAAARIVLVSNEVGYGIVPENRLARRFRDAAGRVNQDVAAAVAHVELVVAGLPLRLK